MDRRTPAQLYALAAGGTLLIVGIVGFFYSADFGSPGGVDDALGLFRVNGWHNALHVAIGAAGLLALGYGARAYAGAVGAILALVAIWGFALGGHGSILGFLPVNGADDVLHAVLGATGLAAYAVEPPR
jgi:hypothetical protein